MTPLHWDPLFARRSPLFAPIAPFAAPFEPAAAFPSPEAIDEALSRRAGVRFVRQEPRPRRRRRVPRAIESMYDARIVSEGVVPTRPGSWHDLLNALVWAAFPTAKRALHERQHEIAVAPTPGISAQRTREGDCLALLDEGGVLVAEQAGSGEGVRAVFGHAIFESLVLGRLPVLASTIVLPACEALEALDAALAGLLADRSRLLDPSELGRIDVEADALRPARPK